MGAQRCNLSVLILGVREKLKLLESVCEARKSGCYVEKLPGKVRQQHTKVFGLTHGALGYTWFATFVHQLHKNNLVFLFRIKKAISSYSLASHGSHYSNCKKVFGVHMLLCQLFYGSVSEPSS